MTKTEFLIALRQQLKHLPAEDIVKATEYCSEMISDRMEDGLDEADAVAAIGSVEEIAGEILSQQPMRALNAAKTNAKPAHKAWNIVLLVLGSPVWFSLFAAIFAVVLAVYIVLWAVVLCFYAVDLLFAVCGIVGFIFACFALNKGNLPLSLALFGAALFCSGLAILFFFLSNKIAKAMLLLSRKIARLIKRCFSGKRF